MYLVLDRGNTRSKIAFYTRDEEVEMKVLETVSASGLALLINEFEARSGGVPVLSGIYSSVVEDNEEVTSYLEQRMNLLVMGGDTPLPITNRYHTPDTLGHDRIAAAVAAARIFPGHNVLTIDAGTCITYDFINGQKEYLGGGIAPGISMRFKALHTFTSKLPLVSLDKEIGLIGNSTDNSIRSGVFNGIVAEIDGIIERYSRDYPGLRIILTGGDANYFDRKLKNDIFAVPNLVLLGLKDILLYNAEK